MDLNGKKVFITCGGGLGDMIVYTPALRAIKEKYPQAHVTFMTKYGNHEVLEGLPYIDKLTYVIRGKAFGRYRVLPDLWHQDAVVFTDWQPQLLFFAKVFGISVRAGRERQGHFLNRYLTKPLPNLVFQSQQYAGRSDADFFERALDIKLPGKMDKLDIARPSEEKVNSVKKKLKKIGVTAPYAVLSPFASQPTRDWQNQDVNKFIRMFETKYQMPVVISAPPSKKEEALQYSRFVLADMKTMEMVALIQDAELCVTPDSGPMHVAGAIGTPCIALFSKDLPSRWAPRSNCIPIYLNEPCSPCNDETASKCQTIRCMRGITAEMVMKQAEKFFLRER